MTPTLLAREIRSDLKGAEDLLEALDIHNTNVVDQHHTIVEGSCVQLLARSLREDVAWYDEGENRIAFCTFIAAQSLRTRRVKDRAIVRLKTRMGLDISRIWDILAVVFAFNAGFFSFFYALSPRLALYSGEPGNDIAVQAWIRLDNEVTDLNLRVALASQRQIYAGAAEPLEELRPYLARAS